jgi:hypothetical protein
MSTKRRRILDDDEDDSEDIKVVDEITAKDMVSRMLKHSKKTNVKLGATKSDSGDLDKKDGGIPRKSQPPIRTAEIPKKPKVTESSTNQPTMLTQSMLPVQPQNTTSSTVTSTAIQAASSTSANSSTRPSISQKDSIRRPPRLPQSSLNESRQSPSKPDNPDSVVSAQQTMAHPHGQGKNQNNSSVKVLTENERQVVKNIQTLCSKIQLNLTPSDDVLSGSFLDYSTDADWEDVDSLTGKKVPIFPEDFGPGQSPWPLSWWGIVEPPVQFLENAVSKSLNSRDGWQSQRRQDSEGYRSRAPPSNTSAR